MKIIREYSGKTTFEDILKPYLENISNKVIENNGWSALNISPNTLFPTLKE